MLLPLILVKMVAMMAILGTLALAGGGIGYFTVPAGLRAGLKMNINLKENGQVYPLYMNPPFPSTSVFYIYEIKNPKGVLKGQKVKLNMKGPYYYSTYMSRDNISFSPSGERIEFNTHRKLHLDEVRSANLDERIWVLDPIFPGLHKSIRDMVMNKMPFQRIAEPIVFNGVNVVLDTYKMRLIKRTSPRDLLEGTKINLLETVDALTKRFSLLASMMPPLPPENTFGVSHAQNHTVDNVEIYTGVGNADKFADVAKWKGKSRMSTWKGKCNAIEGTNGELYKPFPEPGKPLKVFLSQLCRTFNMVPVRKETITLETGMEALEYILSPRLFQGARTNPDNKCYCLDPRTYDCQYDGLLSMGPCFFDAPLYFAKPNFAGVDRRIRSLIDEDSVEFAKLPTSQSFYLEPLSASVLKVNLTLVALFKVVRQPYMRDLANVQNLTYVPVFAASETVVVPEKCVWQLKYLQKFAANYKFYMLVTALSGTGLLLFVYLFGSGHAKKPGPVAPANQQA